MAKLFLDTNIYIDCVYRKVQEEYIENFKGHKLFISPLSIHILFYTQNLSVPFEDSPSLRLPFTQVELNENIIERALESPTPDLEDNIQLQSAVEADCDLFLTRDKKLLKMKFFGKMRIIEKI